MLIRALVAVGEKVCYRPVFRSRKPTQRDRLFHLFAPFAPFADHNGHTTQCCVR